MFYVTSGEAERYGEFASSIRRVGKLAFWLALSAIFGLLTVATMVIHFSVGMLQPRTFTQMLWTLRVRAIGYVLRVIFSFAQVKAFVVITISAQPTMSPMMH